MITFTEGRNKYVEYFYIANMNKNILFHVFWTVLYGTFMGMLQTWQKIFCARLYKIIKLLNNVQDLELIE